ncbi:MAG: insulinase family protein [bacterium]|nr:insulinase family protein [bacterium]
MLIAGCLILVVSGFSFHTQGAQKADNTGSDTGKYFVLENGLQIFLQQRDKIPLVHMVFGINVGSKDESKESNGLVHLLEHLVLLGGSQSFTAGRLVEQIKENGLHFNAHTSHDQMTFEITAPAENAPFAFEFLLEKLFNLDLAPEELEKEKKVILEELSQVEDDPYGLGVMLSLRGLFEGHPYAHPVGGEKAVIEAAEVEALKNFYKKYFIPSNCVLSVVGDFKIETVEKIISGTFGKIKRPNTPDKPPADFKMVSPLKKNVEVKWELDITQAHLFVAFIGPAVDQESKLAMDVLIRILGRGISPLLVNALRGRRRLVENVEIRFFPLKYGGAVLVHLVLEPKNIKYARTQLLRFLKTTRTLRYSKKDYLNRSERNIMDYLETAKAWMALTSQEYHERGISLAQSYARYMLIHGADGTDSAEKNQKSYKERLKAIETADLRKAASDYLSGKKYVTVEIVPAKK